MGFMIGKFISGTCWGEVQLKDFGEDCDKIGWLLEAGLGTADRK